MPMIGFCFQGWVRINLETVQEVSTGDDVDVSDMDENELAQKLKDNIYSVDLVESLRDCEDSNTELHDFDAVNANKFDGSDDENPTLTS